MLNAEVAKRRETAVSRGVGMMTQIYADRALNSEIWDIEGSVTLTSAQVLLSSTPAIATRASWRLSLNRCHALPTPARRCCPMKTTSVWLNV